MLLFIQDYSHCGEGIRTVRRAAWFKSPGAQVGSCGDAGEIRPPMITEIKNAGKQGYWLRLAPVPATLLPSVPLAVPLIPFTIRPAAIVPAPFGLASRRALRRWHRWFARLALALAFRLTFSRRKMRLVLGLSRLRFLCTCTCLCRCLASILDVVSDHGVEVHG